MSAVRAAEPDDAPLLAELHATAFTPGWSAADLAALVAAPGALAFVAGAPNGACAGFLLARVAAGQAELLTLAVRPAARRRGHARALTRALFVALAARDVDEIFLEVAAGNGAARALYAGFGFAEVGRRGGYYVRAGADGDALVLRAPLAPPPTGAGGSHARQNPV